MPTIGVLFTLEGVLIDSSQTWQALMAAAVKHFNLNLIPPNKLPTTQSTLANGNLDASFSMQIHRELQAYYLEHIAQYTYLTTLLPAANDVLSQLDERTIPTAVLSDVTSGLAQTMIEPLKPLPNALVCVDNVQKPKPAPDLIFRACEVLHIDPWDALVVGNSDTDRESAASAGAPFIGFQNIQGNFTISALDEIIAIADRFEG